MDRYFLIFYTGSLIGGGEKIGHLNHTNKDGNFPNLSGIREWLKGEHQDTSNFVITNIIELSKDDFEQWTKS